MSDYNRALSNYLTKVKTQPWLNRPTPPLPLDQRMLTKSQRKKVRAAAREDDDDSYLHRDGYGSDADYPSEYDPSEDFYTDDQIDDMELDIDLDRKPRKYKYLQQRTAYLKSDAAAKPASTVDDATKTPDEPGEVKDDHSFVMADDDN
jgi:hypothetical protein